MDILELGHADHVVLDVGHSAAVTGIARHEDVVVSGARDGFVYVRGTDGRSVVPPAHLSAVTCIALPPDIDVAVVGTVGQVFGVDLATGDDAPLAGFGGTVAVAAATVGDVVLVGCADGSVRSVHAEAGTTVVSLNDGAPVRALVSGGRHAAVSYEDGTVAFLDAAGDELWSTRLDPAEVHRLAVTVDGTVLAAGSGKPSGGDELSGVVLRIGPPGVVEARYLTPGWIDAMTIDGDTVVIAISDGNVHRIALALEEPLSGDTHLGRFFAGVTCLATLDGEVWVGTNGGEVTRLVPETALPSVPSGMFSLNLSSDERRAVATDGTRIVVWDLTTGERIVGLEVDGARAVTFAGEDSTDVLIAGLDGTVERRTGEGLTEIVVSAGPLAVRPHTLGWVGPLVMAFSGAVADVQHPEGAVLIDVGTFETFEPSVDAFDDVSVMRRAGYWFEGTGELDGTRMAVIDREHLVVQRDRLLTLTSGAREWVRIAQGSNLSP
jgi:WD40 repeat protein